VESKCEYSSIQIPNDRKYATAAAIYVSEIARSIGMQDQDLKSLENGILEAVTALMDYSFEPDEKGSLEIICERIPEGLKVSLRDKGLPFGAGGTDSAAAESSSDDSRDMGEPIFRLKEYLDEIRLHNLGPEGKELILIKNLKNKSITDYYAIAASMDELKCRVRQMDPAEAAEVSKTIYKTYGYTYPRDYVYYPEEINALNKSGRIYSAVAVTGEKDIAGYGVFQIWEENPQSETGVSIPGMFSQYNPISVRSGQIPGQAGRLRGSGHQSHHITAYGARIWFQRLCPKAGNDPA
jgi:anti-sigma regulatory factor (Ser/Thr protein kinase)